MRGRIILIAIVLACLPWVPGSASAQDRVPDDRPRPWGRDPFVLPDVKPSQKKIAAEDGLHLSAVIYREGNAVAIINNRILRRGDTVEGNRIEEILQDRVVLRDSAGRHEIRVDQFKMDR